MHESASFFLAFLLTIFCFSAIINMNTFAIIQEGSVKKNKKNVLKWLLNLPSKYKVTVIFLSLISFLSAYLGVTFAVACKKVIDAAQKGDAKAFKTSCVLAAAVIVGLLLSGAAQRFVKGYADATLQKIFRKRFAKNALDKKYEKLSAYHSGELVNRMTSDTTVVAEGISMSNTANKINLFIVKFLSYYCNVILS
jgi:ABC-type multidrug transport system fused ATPase/permease subunit